jgi:hypothetical protein
MLQNIVSFDRKPVLIYEFHQCNPLHKDTKVTCTEFDLYDLDFEIKRFDESQYLLPSMETIGAFKVRGEVHMSVLDLQNPFTICIEFKEPPNFFILKNCYVFEVKNGTDCKFLAEKLQARD